MRDGGASRCSWLVLRVLIRTLTNAGRSSHVAATFSLSQRTVRSVSIDMRVSAAINDRIMFASLVVEDFVSRVDEDEHGTSNLSAPTPANSVRGSR